MKLKNMFFLSLLSLSMMNTLAATLELSPNSNQSQGKLPSGHVDLTFLLNNGDWVESIDLPKNPQSGDKVTLISRATLPSKINTSNTDMPLSLMIQKNQIYSFVFNAQTQLWQMQFTKKWSPSQSPNFNMGIPQSIVISDDNWVSSIRLPRPVADGSLLKVSSESHRMSRIHSDGLLFASTLSLKKGEVHWYKYYQTLNRWVAESTTARQFDVKKIGANMVTVNAAVTQVNFSDSNWVENFTLPASAQDRDRIVVNSTAAWPAKINNTNVNSNVSLNLYQGDRYEFVFIADIAKWVVDSAPVTEINAHQLIPVQLADVRYPMTHIEIGHANWRNEFSLPNNAQIDDKIILKSSALKASQIKVGNGLKTLLRPGETQRYRYSAQGWVIDSHTIDLLMVLDPAVVEKIGESAAKLRMLASIELTNLTAQNSHAQFYLRSAGTLNMAVKGENIFKVIEGILKNPVIKNERNRVGADMVYYESKDLDTGYCGLAYTPMETPVANNMVALGINSCGLTVMRHEIGHNFGLQHSFEEVDTVHRGFQHVLGSTAMGGNTLNFYSSPKLYSPKYAVRLGEEGKVDAVTLLNKHAPIIAQFRTAKM
ncbi:zinc-dependent metalloprotease family protein [Acinetobacter rudis]|uniref:Zinc-dependent metalloprotease family protein n=1 Tax=Acinetobacter rudis TaxID=632955 RepID=A0AAW8J6D3_9GAMM|nr:zinc-dependent metalloprotease family protein [Acinetobacter rudis]MDQ8934993.1 zinc-dependent metalloprotease family protein [Acinetobacter rudis]MDQ9017452.1 zinc-dependent metalloprotease family protein [Acinetobacter rudis]